MSELFGSLVQRCSLTVRRQTHHSTSHVKAAKNLRRYSVDAPSHVVDGVEVAVQTPTALEGGRRRLAAHGHPLLSLLLHELFEAELLVLDVHGHLRRVHLQGLASSKQDLSNLRDRVAVADDALTELRHNDEQVAGAIVKGALPDVKVLELGAGLGNRKRGHFSSSNFVQV